MTTHKAWVSSAIMALVTVILILAYGESPDGMTLEQALEALAGALITGGLAWYGTWRVPNKPKDEGDLIGQPDRLGAPVWATLAAVGLAVLVLSACASNPSVRWAQGQQGYNDVVATLITYRAPCVASEAWPDGGPEHPLCRIDDELYRKIEPVRARVDSALRAWDAALQAGDTVTADFYLRQVEAGLMELRRYLAQAEMEG